MSSTRDSGVATLNKEEREQWLAELASRWQTFVLVHASPPVYFVVHGSQTDSQYAHCALADITNLLEELTRQRNAVKNAIRSNMARSDRLWRDNDQDQRLVDYHQGCISMGNILLDELELR